MKLPYRGDLGKHEGDRRIKILPVTGKVLNRVLLDQMNDPVELEPGERRLAFIGIDHH